MYPREETINEIIIEKSRFICYLKQVKSEEEYKEYLSAIRRKHHDATHVCSALVCHNTVRSSDDGEPSGTAGAPILSVLQKNGLDETCALVVRYFGGIKLGAGGLVRAYGDATARTIAEAQLVTDLIYPKYTLSLPYDSANRIDHYLRNRTILLDTVYDTQVTYTFALADEKQLQDIAEYTRGVMPVQIGEETIRKVVE